ncbi:MAG: CoA transferase [Rhodospirillum sp.]|nr:CoA transferase [Rhodospirillum sp.]MCF8490961.1 CoA transferase [Rhodospirillum sp.]MCF8501479.1 CoA transferase [Rhodospirillum sp.]
MLSRTLEGTIVLDFGQLIAAPVCGLWLADLGATVIKVEPPGGELARHLGPPSRNGESFVSLVSNRDKLGLVLDLKHPRAGDVVAKAASRVDVVLQNFRPGVADRLGIGHDALSAANPDLIYCAISAYGQASPWRDKPGVDGIIQAASGIMSAVAAPGGGPGKVPLPLADMTGAFISVISILAALRNRDAGLGGAFLDIDLFSGMAALQQLDLSAYLTNGDLPVPSGSAASYAAPNETFPTGDGWIMVAAYQPPRWRDLCQGLGRPDVESDPRLATNALRVANRAYLHEVLDPLFRQRSSTDWADRLDRLGIMAAPVATLADVAASVPYHDRNLEVATIHPVAGTVRMPGSPFLAGTDGARAPSPRVGEHSRQALEVLGFDAGEVDALLRDGVLEQGLYQ